MDIQNAILKAMKEESWTPTVLAAAVGLSEGSVRKWMSGESLPSATTLLNLMRVMPGLRKRLGYELREAA